MDMPSPSTHLLKRRYPGHLNDLTPPKRARVADVVRCKKELINRGASARNNTPLVEEAPDDFRGVIEFIAPEGNHGGSHAAHILCLAAFLGQRGLRLAQQLLSAGVDPNAPVLRCPPQWFSWTTTPRYDSLSAAVTSGCQEMIQLLLLYKARVDAHDHIALKIAMHAGRVDIIKQLLLFHPISRNTHVKDFMAHDFELSEAVVTCDAMNRSFDEFVARGFAPFDARAVCEGAKKLVCLRRTAFGKVS